MDQAGTPRIKHFLTKYGYIFLILSVGVTLMLLPVSEKSSPVDTVIIKEQSPQKELSLQQELTELLSQLDGAGKVKILLSKATGEKTIYQTNDATSGSNTVILTDSGRNQNGLIRQIDPPTYIGAVILCQGGDYPSVKLAITQAVSSATGLSYDKITVLKMK